MVRWHFFGQYSKNPLLFVWETYITKVLDHPACNKHRWTSSPTVKVRITSHSSVWLIYLHTGQERGYHMHQTTISPLVFILPSVQEWRCFRRMNAPLLWEIEFQCHSHTPYNNLQAINLIPDTLPSFSSPHRCIMWLFLLFGNQILSFFVFQLSSSSIGTRFTTVRQGSFNASSK